MRLALEDLFRARWTDRIHEEWIASLLHKRSDLTRAQLDRVRALMNRHAPEALVTGYERLIERLSLPDPGDRHVLAAAVTARAGFIVTFNTRDFPSETLDPLGIAAVNPDAFVARLFAANAAAVVRAAARQRAALRNPALSAAEFIGRLRHSGLVITADLLAAHMDTI